MGKGYSRPPDAGGNGAGAHVALEEVGCGKGLPRDGGEGRRAIIKDGEDT